MTALTLDRRSPPDPFPETTAQESGKGYLVRGGLGRQPGLFRCH